MPYETRENTGSLFRNDKKATTNHPDYNGTALIGGKRYYMSAWLKESAKGQKYFSFAFKEASLPPREAAPARTVPAPSSEMIDDEIPF